MTEGNGRAGSGQWLDRNAMMLVRVSIGIVFIWFGALKCIPGMSPAEDLAGKTLGILTFHLVREDIMVRILGGAELLLGAGFVIGRGMRVLLWAFFIHMAGTLTPLVLLPRDTFACPPYCLTLTGQYIIKNLVFITAALLLVRFERIRPRERAPGIS
ncbi:MAG TPA: doxx family protein [Candidatus Kapabacteria bacterium]|nr:doxx family protein [Candidatus Kapabacteria bacterium]